MDWFKKHVDTVIILGAVTASLIWMNGKLNKIETDIVMIKTVLIIRNMMPSDMAKIHDCKEKEFHNQ